MEEKIKQLIDSAHEIIAADDDDTSILLCTAYKKVSTDIYGKVSQIAEMLHFLAERNTAFAKIIVMVANSLQEDGVI